MIASWMLFGLAVSLLLAVAARLLEGALRAAGQPARWVWMAAMAGMLVLIAAAPLRTLGVGPGVVVTGTAGPSTAKVPSAPVAAGWLDAVRGVVRAPLESAASFDASAAQGPLLTGWVLLSMLLGGAGVATMLRARALRRGWLPGELAGVPVRVSPATGPAVFGVRDPEVVVPAWLLDVDEEQQRLVVLHEQEHVRAGDPRLLAAGALAAVLVPWNPVAWWMLLRLRLAVEVDCDGRVLRRGVRPASYGSVLLQVAGRGPAFTLGAPAMAGTASNLERRLRAMTNPLPRFGALRSAALGILGLAAVAAACDTELPTTSEVARMDAASAEMRMRPMMDGNATYTIDGRAATAEEARAIPAERIATIEVRKTNDATGQINIITSEYAAANGIRRQPGGERVALRVTSADPTRSGHPGEVVEEIVIGPGGTHQPSRVNLETFEGLVYIDGTLATQAQARALDPSRIVAIEVVKGPAAAAQSSDPRAQHGVIRITTGAQQR